MYISYVYRSTFLSVYTFHILNVLLFLCIVHRLSVLLNFFGFVY